VLLLRAQLRLRPAWRGAWRKVVPFLRASAPIGLTGAITVIYDRIDVLMVSKLDSTPAAAIYSVPLAVVQYGLLIPSVIGTAFFPIFAAHLQEDRDEARASFFLLARIFLFIAAPLSLFFTAGADDVVTAVFGDRYAGSGIVLSILAWTLVLGFQTSLLWYALLAGYRERAMMAVTAAGLALNVALNAVLIPAYGPKGAACSLLVSSFAVLAGQAWMLQRYVFEISFGRLLARPLLAAALAVPPAVLLRPTSGVLAGICAAAVLAGVLLLTRYVTKAEWAPLTQPLAAGFARFSRRPSN
jgi:O-antigen/teichoic acid export membrane protein